MLAALLIRDLETSLIAFNAIAIISMIYFRCVCGLYSPYIGLFGAHAIRGGLAATNVCVYVCVLQESAPTFPLSASTGGRLASHMIPTLLRRSGSLLFRRAERRP